MSSLSLLKIRPNSVLYVYQKRKIKCTNIPEPSQPMAHGDNVPYTTTKINNSVYVIVVLVKKLYK